MVSTMQKSRVIVECFIVHVLLDVLMGGNEMLTIGRHTPFRAFVVYGDGTAPNKVARFLHWLAALSSCNLLPNPFTNPPDAIVSEGMEAVKGFFEDALKYEELSRAAP